MVYRGSMIGIYDLKLQNMVHLKSYVCLGSLLEGSNGRCILRVTDWYLLSKIAKYGPSVVLCLLGVTT